MNKSTRLLITAAAAAGLYAGAFAIRSYADTTASSSTCTTCAKDKASCKSKDGCKSKDSCKSKDGCKAKEAAPAKSGS
jgi:hypothetical protein